MFPASLYQPIYLILVTVLTFWIMQNYNQSVLSNLNRVQTSKSWLALLICAFMIYFIGNRPVSGNYFVDMANYYEDYGMIFGDRFYFDKNTETIIKEKTKWKPRS